MPYALSPDYAICCSNIYRQVRTTLTGARSSSEAIHGALLTVGELLSNSGDFMAPKFAEACDLVLKYKDSRNKLVRRTVIALLPRLAQYQPDAFISGYLDTILSHLIESLKVASERATAFVALGRVALAVTSNGHHHGGAIAARIEQIIGLVKDGLTPKRNKPFCAGAWPGSACCDGLCVDRLVVWLSGPLCRGVGLHRTVGEGNRASARYLHARPVGPDVQRGRFKITCGRAHRGHICCTHF